MWMWIQLLSRNNRARAVSQGTVAGRRQRPPSDKRPINRPKGPPQRVELLWQAQTVQQYYVLLRKARNTEALEILAGAET